MSGAVAYGGNILLHNNNAIRHDYLKPFVDMFIENSNVACKNELKVIPKFSFLASDWKKSIGPTSSVANMAVHPSYQQIIGMGEDAIPLILRELENEPDHWFWALKSITGEDPVLFEERGRIDKMTKAWLAWGKNEGYEW